MRKERAAAEFDKRKGKAMAAIGNLMEEHGAEPVRAAMLQSLNNQVGNAERDSFVEDFDSDG